MVNYYILILIPKTSMDYIEDRSVQLKALKESFFNLGNQINKSEQRIKNLGILLKELKSKK